MPQGLDCIQSKLLKTLTEHTEYEQLWKYFEPEKEKEEKEKETEREEPKRKRRKIDQDSKEGGDLGLPSSSLAEYGLPTTLTKMKDWLNTTLPPEFEGRKVYV